jgi:hypothetical protein
MRVSNIFLAIFAGAAVAVPAASPSDEVSKTTETVNAQKALVLLTALELARRFQGGSGSESIIRAIKSPGQFDLNGIFGQLSAAIPFDLSGLAGLLNGVSDSALPPNDGSGSSLDNALRELGITPPQD